MRALAPESPGEIPARTPDLAGPAVYAASGLSLAAALVHLWATPELLSEWWGYGAFFLAAALLQGSFAALVLRWSGVYPLLFAGIGVNLGLVLVFVLTRTSGVPVGPHEGLVERATPLDLAAMVAELGAVLALTVLLGGRYRRVAVNAMLALGAALWLLRLAGVLA